jgi:hypothetical protein
MNPREPDNDEPELPFGAPRESDAEGLARAGLLEFGAPASARGAVVGSGRSRALAGMTATSPEEALVKRWMVRLGGLESEASAEALEQGAREAIALMVALREAQASDEAEPLLDCIEAIALQRVRLAEAASSGVGGPPAPAPGYQDLMATARLRDVARHRVEELRRDLYGSSRAPFATMAEATAWVEAEHEQSGEHTPEEVSAFLAAYRKIDVALVQLQLQGSPYDYAYAFPRSRFLELRPGAKVRRYPVGKSVRLKSLLYGLRGLADDLRINEWEAAYFVLLGVPPAVPRYSTIGRERYVFDSGEAPRLMVHVPWIELEIHDRFFSYGDLREVYGYLARTGFLVSRKPPAQLAKLRRLEQFVSQRRPPQGWRGGAVQRALPWKQVLTQWNQANPAERYCLSGIQKAYKEASDYFTGRPTTTSRERGRSRDSGAERDPWPPPAQR